jgi:hypothetical protein
MRGLLGDRFLRRFSSDLNHWRKHQNSTGEGKNPGAEVAAAPEPEALSPEAVRVDSHASEEERDEAGADTNDVPIKAEPSNQNKIGPKAD